LPAAAGRYQFYRPKNNTNDGMSSDRTIVASSRMPKPRPVASTLRSVPGPDASAAKARNRISAVSYRLAHVCGQKQNGRKGERASAR